MGGLDRVEGNSVSTFERNLSSHASRAIARDLPNLSLLLLEVENDHSGKRCNQNPTPDHYVAHCVLLKNHKQRAASPRWLFCVVNYTRTDPSIPIRVLSRRIWPEKINVRGSAQSHSCEPAS
jgi:hypothetical protein